MGKEEVYSHFIQKALIKKWVVNKKEIHYTIYDGKDNHKIFNIKSSNKKQPVTEKGYYSIEIETGINTLENKGITTINKIIQQKNDIILTEKEIITLKFYYILNTIRTDLARNNIKNLNGDYLFNKTIEKENRSAKEIQELKMNILIQKYNNFKKDNNSTFFVKEELELSNFVKNNRKDFSKIIQKAEQLLDTESSIKLQLNSTIKSKLSFVKFINSGELLLTEAGSFQEISKHSSPGSKYNFFVISPEIGILFINKLSFKRHLGFLIEKSKIFNFNLTKKPKILKNNKFKYKLHYEKKETATMCNAMMLVHCKDSYIIYKTKETYYDAIKMCKEKNIYRIEDTNLKI